MNSSISLEGCKKVVVLRKYIKIEEGIRGRLRNRRGSDCLLKYVESFLTTLRK